MNAMIDWIASMITGSMVFLMMLNYYFNISATAVTELFNSTTQEDMTSITEIIEHDVRKAGFRIADSVAFASLDSSTLAVRGDFDNNGTPDTIRYWAVSSPSAGVSSKILYRRVGNQTVTLTANPVTGFNAKYLNAAGAPTLDKKSVRSVIITLGIESKHAYDGEHAGVAWQRTIKPQNVR